MKTPQFRTFRALAVYARQRAKKSAKRNDPIAWAYWKETERWATERKECAKAWRWTDLRQAEVDFQWNTNPLRYEIKERLPAVFDLVFMDAAIFHSRAKWCAAILRAHGKKVTLSLRWMREA